MKQVFQPRNHQVASGLWSSPCTDSFEFFGGILISAFFTLLLSLNAEAGAGPREMLAVEDLARGDSLDFPVEYRLDQVHFERKFASKKFQDPETGGSCTVSLSRSEAAVTLRHTNIWTVQKTEELEPTSEDCRAEARAKIKADYELAQKVLEDSWITESPISRSLYKRKISEQYLKKLDQLAASKQACRDFFSSAERKEIRGPAMVTLENRQVKDRKMYLICDRRNVRLDVLYRQSILVGAPDRASRSWARGGGSGSAPSVGGSR